jgi:hypothetical protein
MEVTAASRSALRSACKICLEEGFEYVWVDCVCIDQFSSLEKAREILNMGEYYAKAARTFVFPRSLSRSRYRRLEEEDGGADDLETAWKGLS